MKKTIYISGIVSMLLVLIGSLFKIQHWPGAGIALTLGLSSLVLVSVPAALINNYRAVGKKSFLALYIVIYLVTLFVYGGALFKIMHWPGAGKILMLAIPLPFFVFVPVFLATISRDKLFSIIDTTIILLFVAYMGVTTALLALNYSKNILQEGTMLDYQLSSSAKFLNELNQTKANKLGEVRGEEARDFVFLSEDMKSGIINSLLKEPVSIQELKKPEYSFGMPYKDNDNVAFFAIYENQFDDQLIKISKDYSTFYALNSEDVEDELKVRWMFYNLPLVHAFSLISDLELDVLLAEKQKLDAQLMQRNP